MTLKQLSKAISDLKHSNVPEHCRPVTSFKESNANELTKSIVAYMRYKGHFARRLSSEGRYRPGETFKDVLGHEKTLKGQWIAGINTGMSDIVCVLKPSGRFLGIEVKYGKDRQGDDQKVFEAQVKAAGGWYFIARTWDGFLFEMGKI